MKTTEGSYDSLIKRAESSIDYWAAEPTVEFIDGICRLMERQQMTRADLARALDSSRSYVTKLLGGNVNFTLVTMAKVAMAIGGALHIHVAEKNAVVHWVEELDGEKPVIVRFNNGPAGGDTTMERYVLETDSPSAAENVAF